MYKQAKWLLPVIALYIITGCAQSEAGGEHINYEDTKKMVVDIIQTDDGKKAMQEIMSDGKMKEQLVLDQSMVSDTIKTTLTSDKGTDMLKKSYQDPKFAAAMGQSMKNENEQLLKDLMKDPEYRAMMIEVLKDPELEKEITNVLKSKEYRQHLQTVITETFESPLYQAKLQSLMQKSAAQMQSGKQGGGAGGGGGQESSGGTGAGGGGAGGGGQ
ncbi:spore germination lipoprotein GerD [Bacillus sp. T33-2]|uniref:spore germination lipoprotein GerD n=1 Tax=Bacillus sp. T33-2 TaxID=2054168 RepID=UPI000C77EF65|nr:spore germination lipoprotein GerD [Bacillus sp. T33-2]PLR96412.1 spore gernimation protein GerD [Bacillus sp. T33-2]